LFSLIIKYEIYKNGINEKSWTSGYLKLFYARSLTSVQSAVNQSTKLVKSGSLLVKRLCLYLPPINQTSFWQYPSLVDS